MILVIIRILVLFGRFFVMQPIIVAMLWELCPFLILTIDFNLIEEKLESFAQWG